MARSVWDLLLNWWENIISPGSSATKLLGFAFMEKKPSHHDEILKHIYDGHDMKNIVVLRHCTVPNSLNDEQSNHIQLKQHTEREVEPEGSKMEIDLVGKTVENKQIILKGYTDGSPLETDMELKVGDGLKLEAPKGSNAIVVKNLYLSCDPYMRGRMRDFHGSYLPPFSPGSAIEGFGVSKVVDSDDPNLKRGDLVSGFTNWEEYSIIHKTKTGQLRKIEQDDGIPLSYHVGLLGMPGFTAYVGFYEVCGPKKGDYVYVSAASGAVGQLVGQLAKLHGCYVVGSAGTSKKVELLKNKLGFDEAFNYKQELDLEAALMRYFPQGIDIYFDNVGGAMLDAALANMRIHGRVAVCGMVSQTNRTDTQTFRNMFSVISKRVTIKGFLQSDFVHLYPRFLEDIKGWYKQGKIVYLEDMNDGLETAPAAFVGLFSGKNVGKQVICVASELPGKGWSLTTQEIDANGGQHRSNQQRQV
ncbi:hypothetical protein L6452_15255 [Arctium lappa]|uniref:Uncharacterized protein n=1 Tax=Arctium lappa TaxID=4217 RepID=A0ACB9CN87_ARCLA|nr:hypothetical protein L6452_15255 [Arctium lappa]